MRESSNTGGFERNINTGMFKAMEAELTLSEYHASVYKASKSANSTFIVKGSIIQKGKNYPVVATFKGGCDIDDGNWEEGKEAERKVKIFVDFYSLEINGIEQCMLDVDNMIARIQSVDLLEAVRNHVL